MYGPKWDDPQIADLGWGTECGDFSTTNHRQIIDDSRIIAFCDHFDPLSRIGDGGLRVDGLRLSPRDLDWLRVCADSVAPEGWPTSRAFGTCALRPDRMCVHDVEGRPFDRLDVTLFEVVTHG